MDNDVVNCAALWKLRKTGSFRLTLSVIEGVVGHVERHLCPSIERRSCIIQRHDTWT